MTNAPMTVLVVGATGSIGRLAALFLERVAEHRLFCNGFRARVEGGKPDFLRGLFHHPGIRPNRIGTSER
jgi:hypothetical protein